LSFFAPALIIYITITSCYAASPLYCNPSYCPLAHQLPSGSPAITDMFVADMFAADMFKAHMFVADMFAAHMFCNRALVAQNCGVKCG
jgi:hypothetical protein